MGANYARTKIETKLENNQGGIVEGGGTKMRSNRLSLLLRDVLAELVRRKRGRT